MIYSKIKLAKYDKNSIFSLYQSESDPSQNDHHHQRRKKRDLFIYEGIISSKKNHQTKEKLYDLVPYFYSSFFACIGYFYYFIFISVQFSLLIGSVFFSFIFFIHFTNSSNINCRISNGSPLLSGQFSFICFPIFFTFLLLSFIDL